KTAAYIRQTGYAPVSDGVIHIAFRSTPEEKLIIRRDGRDRCADNLRKARMPVSPWRALPFILVALIMLGAPVAHASVVGSDGSSRAPRAAATQDDEQSVKGTLHKPNGDPLPDVTVTV